MRHWVLGIALATFSMPAISITAMADNIAACELVLMEVIEDESGQGGGAVASYRPAADFLADLYSEDAEPSMEVDGLKIRAVMCARNNVIANKSDFKILATGLPFILSQNYESVDSDMLTYYYADGQFQYQYKGPGLIDETQADLDDRLAYFNAQEHDLPSAPEEEDADTAAEDSGEPIADKKESKDTPKQKELSMEKIESLK